MRERDRERETETERANEHMWWREGVQAGPSSDASCASRSELRAAAAAQDAAGAGGEGAREPGGPDRGVMAAGPVMTKGRGRGGCVLARWGGMREGADRVTRDLSCRTKHRYGDSDSD